MLFDVFFDFIVDDFFAGEILATGSFNTSTEDSIIELNADFSLVRSLDIVGDRVKSKLFGIEERCFGMIKLEDLVDNFSKNGLICVECSRSGTGEGELLRV